ncbi:hypothetical protein N8E87_00975 [Avibacterium paragallinarum]|uniref:hypothetical protein n=1 Tax=Avibacterium paragallinarum TaxID=728 RepID=UPI0021F6D747|nr:hypothetical protein [Avibacterium paragallinarum]UXN37105.1 hypothetical protein N8E87_00975 [Avibacterium paragallinarum]
MAGTSERLSPNGKTPCGTSHGVLITTIKNSLKNAPHFSGSPKAVKQRSKENKQWLITQPIADFTIVIAVN